MFEIVFIVIILYFLKLNNAPLLLSIDTWDDGVKFDHLMFFAMEEKTEDPTPKKLKDAKKKGQVAKSKELLSFASFTASALILVFLGGHIYEIFSSTMVYVFEHLTEFDLTKSGAIKLFTFGIFQFLKAMTFVLVPLVFVSIFANVAQVGFNFSTEPLKFDLKKMSPIEGFKRLFSKKVVFDLFKNISKLLLMTVVVYIFFKSNLSLLFHLMGLEPEQTLLLVIVLYKDLTMRIGLVLLVLAIADFFFEKYSFKKKMRMTKHEIKEEFKQTEGDPLLKSMRRQKQKQIAFNRMLSSVPKATVIVTNPTHFAVAIQYDLEGTRDEIPKVLAKGVDFMAQKIKEVAKENDIPIIENKLLARALYRKTEPDQLIPMELYQAVAEILAAVYKLNRRK